MTCHCRSTLPAVGTNERMRSLSASFKRRQTKRITAISDIVKITEPYLARRFRPRATPPAFPKNTVLHRTSRFEGRSAVAPHLRGHSRRYNALQWFVRRFRKTGHHVFRRAKALVGLDIGSSAVKAVELKAAGKSYRVTAFGTEALPPDSIVDGAIIDGAAVAAAIRRPFEGRIANIRTKGVAASLTGNAVIVKKISLPITSDGELAESIYWEAEQYIPFDIQYINLDYQILDAGRGPDSKGTMDVLLVAAKIEKIADYMGVITQAGRDRKSVV